jgi:hypothetical protein
MFVADARVRSILVAALLILPAGCNGDPPVDQWKTVSHAPFRIKMPGDPAREDKTVPLSEGKMQITSYNLLRG